MKQLHSSILVQLAFLGVLAGFLAPLAVKADEALLMETRAYSLGGYIPKFYEVPSLTDPFDEDESAAYEKQFKEYQQGIISYLKEHGIEAQKTEFKHQFNALFLTDKPEKLAMHEVMLRFLFQPDMQLKAIESAKKMLADRKILEGDQVSRVAFLDEITFRAFHGEVRKLEGELEALPESNPERKIISERLKLAKEFRESAIKLYLESLEEQKKLIEHWQKVTNKIE